MARKRRMKSNFFFVCDTCDSKKTTSLLEGARIYAREGLEGDKQSVDTGKQWYEHTETREYRDTEIREGWELGRQGEQRRKVLLCSNICYVENTKSLVRKIKMLLFRDFFTLWGFFNPYTYRRSAQCPSLHSFRIDVVCHSFKSTNYATFSSTIQLRWISSFVFSPWHNSGKLGSAHLA